MLTEHLSESETRIRLHSDALGKRLLARFPFYKLYQTGLAFLFSIQWNPLCDLV